MKKECNFLDIFKSIPNKKYQISQEEIMKKWKIPVISQWQEFIEWFSNNIDRLYSNNEIIVFWDHTTVLKYVDFDFIVWADGVKLLQKKNEDDDLLYLYYLLSYNNISSEWFKRHYSILKEKQLNKHTNIKEQKQISKFLSSIDKNLTLLKEEKKQMQEYKKGIMQKIFNQEIRFKDVEGNEFGEWENIQIKDIFEVLTFSNKKEDINWQNFLLWMWSIDINWNIVLKNKTNCKKDLLKRNDLIMPTRDIWDWWIIWKVGLINQDNLVCWNNLYVFRVNNINLYNVKYLYYVINQYNTQKSIHKNVQKWVVNMLNKWDVIEEYLRMPSINEQEKIANFISDIDKKLENLDKEIEKVENYKKGVMQEIFG